VLVQKALQTKTAPGAVPGPEKPGGVDNQDNRAYRSAGREEQQ
jgi:hypothetical protein